MKHVFFILALLFSVTLASAQGEHVSKGNTNEGIGTAIPDFKFYDALGKPVTKASLAVGKPVIFFYFDPDCDHCQLISKSIVEQKSLFRGITFVLVSWAEVDAIKAFAPKYLAGYTYPMWITKDKDYMIDKWFGYSETPSLYVYNAKWKRTASFKDEVRPEILVKFAKQQ
jgi:peroxiredoxin